MFKQKLMMKLMRTQQKYLETVRQSVIMAKKTADANSRNIDGLLIFSLVLAIYAVTKDTLL